MSVKIETTSDDARQVLSLAKGELEQDLSRAGVERSRIDVQTVPEGGVPRQGGSGDSAPGAPGDGRRHPSSQQKDFDQDKAQDPSSPGGRPSGRRRIVL